MSSRFVSAGSFGVEAGVAQPAAATSTAASKPPPLASSIAPSGNGPAVAAAGDRDTAAGPAAKSAIVSSTSPPPLTGTTTTAKNPDSVPQEGVSQPEPEPSSEQSAPLNPKSAEWAAVQAQIAQEREARLKAKQAAASGGEAEKSLYAVLQANKAAKQAAFEEANKIKNQFRALDDDEIDFLDEVLMRKRAEEQRIRRETEEGLSLFRKAQMGENRKDGGEEEDDIEMGVTFEAGRKRRRKGHETDGRGGKRVLVRRKTSGDGAGDGETGTRTGERTSGLAAVDGDKVPLTASAVIVGEAKSAVVGVNKAAAAMTKTVSSASGGGGLGGLVGYGSSDEDDD